MSSVLHLNLHRQFFEQVRSGRKKTEWRDRSAYWAKRLEGREYTHIVFSNGYSPNAPKMIVELLSVGKVVRNAQPMYAIKLGKLIAERNTLQ